MDAGRYLGNLQDHFFGQRTELLEIQDQAVWENQK